MSVEFTEEQARQAIARVRELIQSYFKEHNISYAVFGKSEGLDSSVIAGLLSNLEGVKPIGVVMPCESDVDAERIAVKVLNHFKIPWIKVDLCRVFHNLMGLLYASDGVQGQLSEILLQYGDEPIKKGLSVRKAMASGNIKARLRMITLYHIAQLTQGVVVSTDNFSEFWMGFWTLNGDVGDLAPIQQIWKGLEEYTIARALGVPEESLNAAPTDGLDVIPGGIDQDQLGLPYEDLDRVIISLLRNQYDGNNHFSETEINSLVNTLSTELGHAPQEIQHVIDQMRRTRFKRAWPRCFTRDEIGLQYP